MRHGKKFNHLGRKAGHRKALLRNLSIALITHKRITTTLAKAKALRRHIEPLITKAKVNTTHSRRVIFSYLENKEAIQELFGPIAEKVGARPGGYVRVIRTGFRPSDGSEMAMIELVDFNEVYDLTQETGKATGRRRRRRGGSKTEAAQPAAATTAAVVEEEAEEEAQEEAEEEEAVSGEEEVTEEISETTEEEDNNEEEEKK